MTTFGFRRRRGYLLCFTARTRTKTPQSLMPAQSPQGILKRSTAGHNHPTPPKTLLEWNYGWVDMIKKNWKEKNASQKKKEKSDLFCWQCCVEHPCLHGLVLAFPDCFVVCRWPPTRSPCKAAFKKTLKQESVGPVPFAAGDWALCCALHASSASPLAMKTAQWGWVKSE